MTSIFKPRRRTFRSTGLLASSLGLARTTTLVAGSLADSPSASASETFSQTFAFNHLRMAFKFR